MRGRSFVTTLCVLGVLAALPLTTFGDVPPLWPGTLGGGVTLLPNGWKIAPAGQHLQVGSFPLGMVESPDGRFLFIANSGYLKPSITVVDIKARRVADTLVLDHAWLGLAWILTGKRFYAWAGANPPVPDWGGKRGKLPGPDPEEGAPPPPKKAPPVFAMKLPRGTDRVLGRPMQTPAEGSNRPEPVPQ